MLRIILVTVVLAVATLAQSDQYWHENEEVFVSAEDLPPGTLVRVRRQLFGGLSPTPTGFNQQVGYKGSLFSSPTKDLTAWGSLSQNYGSRGFGTPVFSSPITYKGGADLATSSGNAFSFSGIHIPTAGTQATASGKFNILNTPSHNLDALASHTKTFDTHFKEFGHGTTKAGVAYQNKNGAELNLVGTRTPGAPNSATLGSALPLYANPNTGAAVNLNTQSTFTDGSKPAHTLGVELLNGKGASVAVSGSKIPGAPDSGSITGTIPLYKDKTTSVNLNAQSNFASGSKPDHGIGVSVSSSF